jgi:hypothetical protein
MEKTLTIDISTALAKTTIFAALLAVAVGVPIFVQSQWITGPIVNSTLFTATFVLGPVAGILIALIPSLVALTSGLLPLPLAPMVPFIMVGNVLLVVAFHYLKTQHFAVKVTLAAVIKFLFLWQVTAQIMTNMLPDPIVKNLLVMMTWPQLYTALIGGLIAFALLKSLKRL